MKMDDTIDGSERCGILQVFAGYSIPG